MSGIEFWDDGRQVATSTEWTIKGLIFSGYIKADNIHEHAIVVDELSGGRKRILPLGVFLEKQMGGYGQRQNFVHDIRVRAREIAECAEALERLLGLRREEGGG